MTQFTQISEGTSEVSKGMNDNDFAHAEKYVSDVLFQIRENYQLTNFEENTIRSWGFDIIIPHGLITSVSLKRLADAKITIVIFDVDFDTKALRLACWIDKGDVQ